MRIAICDDEENTLLSLNYLVKEIIFEYDQEFDIITFDKSNNLIRFCRDNITDIVLLDIDMPETDGFNAVEELRKYQSDIAVIFITAHEELAYQAYDYQPFWFVSKMKLDKLSEVLGKLIKKVNSRKTDKNIIHLELKPIVSLNVDETAYIKSNNHYMIVYDINNNSIIKFRGGIKDVYKQLCQRGFIFVQRSYIVNCRFIKRFDSKCIVLNNGHTLTVTRNAQMLNEAHRLYGKFMREMRW